jgi:hypothetical protein
MRDHTLFCTYLNDLLWQRRQTPEDLADKLAHADTTEVRSWLNGWSVPRVEQLGAVARALDTDPVTLTFGWQIDADPTNEERIWRAALTPLGAAFPKSDDLALHMSRPRRNMTVDDPHDGREPKSVPAACGTLRKRSAAARLV